MFICQSRLENAIGLHERYLQEAGRDASSQQFTDLGRQLTETGRGVVVLIGSGIVEIAIWMKRGQFSKDFPQFQIDIEGSKVRRFNQRLESGSEPVERSQAHHLLELDSSHGVDAKSPARDLQDQLLAAAQDLAA